MNDFDGIEVLDVLVADSWGKYMGEQLTRVTNQEDWKRENTGETVGSDLWESIARHDDEWHHEALDELERDYIHTPTGGRLYQSGDIFLVRYTEDENAEYERARREDEVPDPDAHVEPCGYFDRFDIVEAYSCYLHDWHKNMMTERDRDRWTADRGRPRSITIQLHDMNFRPRPNLSTDTLTENGRAIYDNLVQKWEGETS